MLAVVSFMLAKETKPKRVRFALLSRNKINARNWPFIVRCIARIQKSSRAQTLLEEKKKVNFKVGLRPLPL